MTIVFVVVKLSSIYLETKKNDTTTSKNFDLFCLIINHCFYSEIRAHFNSFFFQLGNTLLFCFNIKNEY